MNFPDVIVVGAGVNGLMSAAFLAREGFKVSVLERRAVGAESSWAGGGILSPLAPWRYPEAVNRLAHWGGKYYAHFSEELAADTGVDCEYWPCGMIYRDLDDSAEALQWTSKWGMSVDRGMDGTDSLFFPAVAQIRNPRLLNALQIYTRQLGVTVQLENATGFMTHGDRVTGVMTRNETYHCEHVVVCAGAWSNPLLSSLGLVLDHEPVKGQMLLFRADKPRLKHIYYRHGHYLIPRRDGRILAGSTLEKNVLDKRCTRQAYDELGDFARDLFEAMDMGAVMEAQWAGIRPGSQSGIPTIGPAPLEGLWVNTGQYRNGIILAPASARLLCDQMAVKKSEISTHPYAWSRVK